MSETLQITTDLSVADMDRLDRAVVRERAASSHTKRVSRSSYLREAILQRLERDEAAAEPRSRNPGGAKHPLPRPGATPGPRSSKGGAGAVSSPTAPARRRSAAQG